MNLLIPVLQRHAVNNWNALIEFIEDNTSTVGRQEVVIEDVEQLEKLLHELRDEITTIACIVDPETGKSYASDGVEILHWSVNPEL